MQPARESETIPASYELAIARSASSGKAPNTFMTRTACLSRTPGPLSASDTPTPLRPGGPLGRLSGIRVRYFGTPCGDFRRIGTVKRAGWCNLARYLYWCESLCVH